MSTPYDSQRTGPVEVFAGVALTCVAHVALGTLLFLVESHKEPEERQSVELLVIDAELAALGDVLPVAGQLPEIANPEEAPEDAPPPDPTQPIPEETSVPDSEVVVLEQEPQPTQEQERTVVRADEVQQNRDAPDRADRGETNPNRPTNDRPRVGFQDGYAGGTSLSESALRNQFAIIQSQIGRQIERPLSIDEATWRSLNAVYFIRVAVNGQIVEFEQVRGSGNHVFDAQIEVALNRFRNGRERLRLNSLNDEFREAFISEGFRINVRP